MTSKELDHPTIHTRRLYHILSSTLESKDSTGISHEYPGATDALNAGSLYVAQHGKDFDADARAKIVGGTPDIDDVAKGSARKIKGPTSGPDECLNQETRQFMSETIGMGGNLQSMSDTKAIGYIEKVIGRKLMRTERREALKLNHALADLPKPDTTATKQQLRNLGIVRKMTLDAEPSSCR